MIKIHLEALRLFFVLHIYCPIILNMARTGKNFPKALLVFGYHLSTSGVPCSISLIGIIIPNFYWLFKWKRKTEKRKFWQIYILKMSNKIINILTIAVGMVALCGMYQFCWLILIEWFPCWHWCCRNKSTHSIRNYFKW